MPALHYIGSRSWAAVAFSAMLSTTFIIIFVVIIVVFSPIFYYGKISKKKKSHFVKGLLKLTSHPTTLVRIAVPFGHIFYLYSWPFLYLGCLTAHTTEACVGQQSREE